MEYITDWKNYISDQECSVTLGKFDGVHRGHRKLIRRVKKLARQNGWKPAVYTFTASPENVPGPGAAKLLMTDEERKDLLREMDVDLVMACPFTADLRNMEAEDFVTKILSEKLRARVVVVGPDYRFGKGRKGDPEYLAEMGGRLGFEVEVLAKEQEEGIDISSSLIRDEVAAGHMERVKLLLGYPYFVTGEIVHGRHLGHSLGFPTINQLPPGDKLLPPNGVYISRTYVGGRWYQGVSNIGCKPTVKGDSLGVETYLFDCSLDLYGQNAKVELLAFRRPERKFGSIEELKEQMDRDIQAADAYPYE